MANLVENGEQSLDDWFRKQILPHERALTHFLKRAWRVSAEVSDLRQEVYVRVYESAARNLPTSPRAFLMSTARNLVIDRLRRERIVSIDLTQDIGSLNISNDLPTPDERASARQQLRRLESALNRLSEDCRAVIWLRRVEGLSQRQVAARLGLLEGTVASHLCRGLRELTKVVFSDDPDPAPGAASAGDLQERRRE